MNTRDDGEEKIDTEPGQDRPTSPPEVDPVLKYVISIDRKMDEMNDKMAAFSDALDRFSDTIDDVLLELRSMRQDREEMKKMRQDIDSLLAARKNGSGEHPAVKE